MGPLPCLNFSNPAVANIALSKLKWSQSDKGIITIFIPTIVIIGILANAAFLFTVARVPRMKTVTNYYLVNLSIADMLFMIFTLGSYLGMYYKSPLKSSIPATSTAGCWVNTYPIYLSYYASVLLVTLVALERFFTICMPLKHRLIKGKVRTIKIIIVCWVLSLLLAATTTPRYGLYKQRCIIWPSTEEYQYLPAVRSGCVSVSLATDVAAETIQSFTFFLSLAISCFTYIRLMRTLSTTPPTLAWSGRGRSERDKQIRKQVARLLMINGLVFFICQLPARVLNMDRVHHRVIDEPTNHTALMYAIGHGLLVLNSAVNPFIYGLSSRFYRVSFCHAFGIASYLKMERSTSLVTGSSFVSRSSSFQANSSLRINLGLDLSQTSSLQSSPSTKNKSNSTTKDTESK